MLTSPTQPLVEFLYGPVLTYVRAPRDIIYWFDSLLTVPNPTGWPTTFQFFQRGNSALLTGHLHLLERELIACGISYQVHNRPPMLNLGNLDPNILQTEKQPNFVLKPFQVSTTRKMLLGRRGGIQLATGAGKTASYIAALKWLGQIEGKPVSSLTIVTVTNLAKQMVTRMKRAGLKASILRRDSWGNADHIVAVINGLHRSWSASNPKIIKMLANRRVLCLDEAHHGQAEMCYQVISACQAEYRWFLSATLYANRANPYAHVGDMRLLGQSGPTLAILPAKFLWESGYVAEPRITFVPMSWPDASDLYSTRIWGRRIDSAVWRGTGKNAATTGVEWDLIVNNTYRNEFIRRYVYWRMKQEPEQTKVVILVQRIDHGKILQRMLSMVGVRSAFCFGGHKVVTLNNAGDQREWVDRKDSTLSDFDVGNLKVLIGSQKFDEGQSFPLFSDLILAQAGRGGEANRRVYQRVGRGLHSGIPVHVVDFYDQTHRMVQRQAEARLLALHNEGYPVQVAYPPEVYWKISGIPDL